MKKQYVLNKQQDFNLEGVMVLNQTYENNVTKSSVDSAPKVVPDDIVTRLRNYDFMRDGDIPDVIMSVAADEIERLRAELDDWRRVAETEHIRFTNELKAVRGEYRRSL